VKCNVIAVAGGMLVWRPAWLLCGAGVRHSTSSYLAFGAAIAGGCGGMVVVIRDDVDSIGRCQHGQIHYQDPDSGWQD